MQRNRFQRFLAVGALRNDVQIRFHFKQRSERSAHEALILDEYDADHRRNSSDGRETAKHVPAAPPRLTLPRYAATRSQMPARPFPSHEAPPMPSSRISR